MATPTALSWASPGRTPHPLQARSLCCSQDACGSPPGTPRPAPPRPAPRRLAPAPTSPGPCAHACPRPALSERLLLPTADAGRGS